MNRRIELESGAEHYVHRDTRPQRNLVETSDDINGGNASWATNAEMIPDTQPAIDIPRDKRGRIRWEVLVTEPERMLEVIEYVAEKFVSEGNHLSYDSLNEAKLSGFAVAVNKKYPGGIIALKQKVEGTSKPHYRTRNTQDGLLLDDRGRVFWKLPRNTPEENEQLGIKNIQALFLKRFPEFDQLFPREEDGKIVEDKREKARKFILERVKKKSDLRDFVPSSADNKNATPYFGGNFRIIITKAFEPWGIKFDRERPESAPEGWMTLNAFKQLERRGSKVIKKISDGFRITHPEWFRTYLAVNNTPREHFAPELITLIAQELERYSVSPSEWITNCALAKELQRDFKTIKNIVQRFRSEHPEWFQAYADSSGKLCEHYSPQLVEEIKKIVESRKKKNGDRENPISPQEAREELSKLIEG